MPALPTSAEVAALLPEIILVVAMVAALLAPVLPPFRRACATSHTPMMLIGFVGVAAALVSALTMLVGETPERHVFYGMLAVDRFALSIKVILYLFTLFVLGMWFSTTRDQVRTVDGPDYMSLILGGLFGMSLMASATNFLMVLLAIEAASFPSYALAGFLKHTRRGSEASLKYVLFGAAASAIMIYGLSMLYGAYGTFDIASIAAQAAQEGMGIGLLLGLFGLLVGIGFKVSAVPVHFWCPDVFEGAPFEITTFLSVASKGAAVALLLRILLSIGHYVDDPELAEGMLLGITTFVGLIGLATATWGNLAAYFQDNIKRLLAYSSIAHAGYMLMAVALLGSSVGFGDARGLTSAIVFYIFVYSWMNLGAFTVAAVVAASTGSESIRDYAGLSRRNPWLAFVLGCFLLSLFGMPLTGGFWGKVYLGFQMWDQQMWWLVLGLVINTVFSLYFYLKPIIIMVWKPGEGRPAVAASPAAWTIIGAAMLGVFGTGILPDLTTGWVRDNALIQFDAEPVTTAMSAADAAATPATEVTP